MLTKILFASVLISVSLGRSTKAPKTQLKQEKQDDLDMESDSDVNIYDYGIGEPILDVVALDDVIESRKKVYKELKTQHAKKNQQKETTQKPTKNARADHGTQVTLEDIVKSKDTIIAKLKAQIEKRNKKLLQVRENLQNIIDDLNLESE